MIVLCAAPENSAEAIQALTGARGILVVAVTSRLADLAPLCGAYSGAVLVVLAARDVENRELVAHISSRECATMAGVVIVGARNAECDADFSELPFLVLRMGRRRHGDRSPFAYYF